ncbi:hypothetical protein HZB88_03755, partial [archaeon]|nr:hypothetical protein [archaeon]
IGSDVNYDRYSWIPTFTLNPQMVQETKNETIFIYQGGGFPLDDDFTYKQGNETKIFPSGKAGIAGIRIVMNKEQEIKDVGIFMFYNSNNPTLIPLKCIYYNNKMYDINEDGYDGCFAVIHSIVQSDSGTNINPIGAGIFLGERTKKTLFAKLFIFNEGEYFSLAHSEDDFVVADLKSRGAVPEWQDFVLYGGLRGPIKIWEVKYPDGIQIKPEYLETAYPPELQRAG